MINITLANNEIYEWDYDKEPHILIEGETGSGKKGSNYWKWLTFDEEGTSYAIKIYELKDESYEFNYY